MNTEQEIEHLKYRTLALEKQGRSYDEIELENTISYLHTINVKDLTPGKAEEKVKRIVNEYKGVRNTSFTINW